MFEGTYLSSKKTNMQLQEESIEKSIFFNSTLKLRVILKILERQLPLQAQHQVQEIVILSSSR
jgi:hypothetical protein